MVTNRKVNKQPLSDRDFTLIYTSIVEILRKNLGDSQKEFKNQLVNFSTRIKVQ